MPWAAVRSTIRSAKPRRRRSLLGGFVSLVVLLVLTGCTGGAAGPDGGSALEPRVYEPPVPAPALDGLVDTAGRSFSLEGLTGRVVLVNFGYTHCPDVCPTTLAVDREVLRARPDRAAVVFITVDPERDTAAALASYLAFFEAPIVGLTGDRASIAAVTAAWGVTVVLGKPDATGNYPVIHTAGTYLVDPQGRLRFLYPYGTPADTLVTAVDHLVAEP